MSMILLSAKRDIALVSMIRKAMKYKGTRYLQKSNPQFVATAYGRHRGSKPSRFWMPALHR